MGGFLDPASDDMRVCVSFIYTHVWEYNLPLKILVYLHHSCFTIGTSYGLLRFIFSRYSKFFFSFENNYSLVSIGSLPNNFRRVIFSYIYIYKVKIVCFRTFSFFKILN